MKIIKCVYCGQEFEFTDGEQKFYIDKNFPEPKRCKTCREARKQKFERRVQDGK